MADAVWSGYLEQDSDYLDLDYSGLVCDLSDWDMKFLGYRRVGCLRVACMQDSAWQVLDSWPEACIPGFELLVLANLPADYWQADYSPDSVWQVLVYLQADCLLVGYWLVAYKQGSVQPVLDYFQVGYNPDSARRVSDY